MHHGSSTIDAFFLNVKEGVDEMIKFLANEPSVGLFFVQQHAQTSMPYLLDVNDKFGTKIHEVTLHTEDIEDSICSVRSMREYGIPIAEEMIKDINKSILIMSTSQPKRGLICNPSLGCSDKQSSLQESSTSSSGSVGSNRSYLSSVFNSAKLKAAGLRWSQSDVMAKGLKSDHLSSATPLPVIGYPTPTVTDTGTDGLPLPTRPLDDNQLEKTVIPVESLYTHDLSSVLQDYDKFKAEREAKYKEWLRDPKNSSKNDESLE
ncbi:hypothetical protein Cni_G04070 [Canna indica]|uniref:Uncharacterized protein n=1 Tax=Canna indica TaxID=4628 RepID=A0AAQ3Q2E5_9LILI|nr:hypothetical protein Cni_G04070 [Canna indica]